MKAMLRADCRACSLVPSCLLTLKPEWAHDLEVASRWSSCHIWHFKPESLHFMDINWLFTTAFQASPARTSTKHLSGSHCRDSKCRHLLAGHDLKQHLAELNWAAKKILAARQSNIHRMSILPILPILQFQQHFILSEACQCALIASHSQTPSPGQTKVQSHWLKLAVAFAKKISREKRQPRRQGWTDTTLKRS